MIRNLFKRATVFLSLFIILAGCNADPFNNSATQSGPIPPDPNLELTHTMSPTEPHTPDSTQTLSAIPIPTIVNPSFEEGETSGTPTGWTISGQPESVLLETGGHESDTRLTHRGTESYQVETTQTVTGLSNDWYTLRAWIRSSGGQKEVYISLQCGDGEKRVYIPSTLPGYRWMNLVVSNKVSDGECVIRLFSDGNAETWASFDDVELIPGQTTLSILGADISSLKKSEDFGGVYRDTDGEPGDALQILKNHGLNYARLRVWLDPADGYHNKEKLLEMALRFKDKGIKLLVNFHYSDNWADPGKQIKPAAWEDLNFEQLKQALYDHTFDVCSSLIEQGTPPDMVQVGNEINSGMLWPDGHTWDPPNWDNLAQLLIAGYNAVKACSPNTLVMLHIAEGGDNELAKWWFGNIFAREIAFDVIGISYYPYWHGTLAELQHNLNDIAEHYSKDVIVVETAYAFTTQNNDFLSNIFNPDMEIPGYPITPEGQRTFLRDLMGVVRAVPNGRGLGVFYWDATWTAVKGNGWENSDPNSGNAWENQALFDYDEVVLPALDEYLNP